MTAKKKVKKEPKKKPPTKKKPAKKNKGGRPKKIITKKLFEELCKLQCSMDEICEVVGVTDKTLTKWCKETYGKSFSGIFKAKRGKGKISLRRNMMVMAQSNAAVAIFLAKNWLGMKDKPEEDSEAVKPTPVTVNINVKDCSKPKEPVDES